MFQVTDELVKEFSYTNCSENTIRFNISKAVNMIPNKNYVTLENVKRLAKNLLERETKKVSSDNDTISDTNISVSGHIIKSTIKKGRTPLYRGKLLLAGTKNNKRDFWLDYKNALEIALDDALYPNAQPKGFYNTVKEFLKNDWKDRQYFKREELIKALSKKYPEIEKIKLQCWGNMYYWQNTNEIAVKPLWKIINRHSLENIFYRKVT